MADSRDDPRIFLLDPDERGVLPLTEFHIPRRLRRTVRQDPFTITVDKAFAEVVSGCSAPRPQGWGTWINRRIHSLYVDLHRTGAAHSVEVWDKGVLVGGLYGVRLGGAFFGESMFSRARDASKVALVHLVARLVHGGFQLLDAQFITEHLRQFGAREIARSNYHRLLSAAIDIPADFRAMPKNTTGVQALEIIDAGQSPPGG